MKGGLLGADFAVENGRYRFARVYDGENWNPELRAPLTQPGVNVVAGEYLLAVNGRGAAAADEPISAARGDGRQGGRAARGPDARRQGRARRDGRPGRRRVAACAASPGSRATAARSTSCRRAALAYVYLPDTASGGYTAFNRYYFAQVDRQGAVPRRALQRRRPASPTTSSTSCAGR